MPKLSVIIQLLLLSDVAFLLASGASLRGAIHPSSRAAGVFLLIEGGKYTFNFTAARDACMLLNVTIATRAQMDRAVQLGLETCKFGWTAEQVGVIPRLTADEKCGQGKTGVVRWAASADKKFGAFCFNVSDLEETPTTSTSNPQSLTTSTKQPTETPASTRLSPPLNLSTQSSTSRTTTTATTELWFTSSLPVSTKIPSTSTSHKPSSTHGPDSSSQLSTANTTAFTFIFSTSDISVSTEGRAQPGLDSTNKSRGDGLTALIALGIIVLLLTAASILWFYKINLLTLWPKMQQKDDIETEMWKHTDSEFDLHGQREGEEEVEEEEEEEETDRKYSSDITLCVNPEIKINS